MVNGGHFKLLVNVFILELVLDLLRKLMKTGHQYPETQKWQYRHHEEVKNRGNKPVKKKDGFFLSKNLNIEKPCMRWLILCQFGWPKEWPDTWQNISGCVSEGVLGRD